MKKSPLVVLLTAALITAACSDASTTPHDSGAAAGAVSDASDHCAEGMTTGDFSSSENTISIPPAEFAEIVVKRYTGHDQYSPDDPECWDAKMDSVHIGYMDFEWGERVAFDSTMPDSRTIQVTVHTPHQPAAQLRGIENARGWNIAAVDVTAAEERSFVVTLHSRHDIRYRATNERSRRNVLGAVRLYVAAL